MGAYDQFIWFGDSLTQQAWNQEEGFAAGAAVQNAYLRRLDIINRGFSGYNSSQALNVLPMFMPTPAQASVRIMLIFFGTNDACLPGTTGQYVPLDIYKANLKRIATHATIQLQGPRLILVTPPPLDENKLGAHMLTIGINIPTRTVEQTKTYADATREVGLELGLAVLDLWSIFMKHAGWKEGQPLAGSKNVPENRALQSLLRDGLHFNPEAYKLLADTLVDLIRQKWPDQDPDALPFVFPPYQELLLQENGAESFIADY